MECPRCLLTSDIARIGETQCEYCDIHDKMESERDPSQIDAWVDLMRMDGMGRHYDCLVGLSGGFDSSLMLHLAVKVWGLRPFVLHMDNGLNEPFADRNMRNMCDKLGIVMFKVRTDAVYDQAVRAMLLSGTPDADIVNDIAMTKLMYETAMFHGIKYILNGHDYRTEGSTPRAWTQLDSTYLKDVYHRFTGRTLPSKYTLTMRDQVRYGLRGIRNIRPFYHAETDRAAMKRLLMDEYGWEDYPLKHAENIYTAWVGYKLLPLKFGIDKRRVYLSALIRSGVMTKRQAKTELRKPCEVKTPVFYLIKLMLHNTVIMGDPPVPRSEYKSTNYRRWRLVVWALVKLGVLPYTFYIKYCKR